MSNKSKILMIGPDKNAQGGIASVIKLYEDFKLDFDNVIYLSTYTDGTILLKFIVYFFFLLKYLILLLFRQDIRLVHIHTSSNGSFFRKSIISYFAKLFHKKTILHVHGSEFMEFYASSFNFVKKIIKNTLDNVDLVIVLSQQWKDNILTISKNSNIKVLYNSTILKEVKHISSDGIKVLFMGRLGKRKGLYDIIEAAKYIQNPEVLINLYGDGDIEKFQKLIIENNVQDKVKIKGWISGDKKDEVFRCSDIYILPSYNEGLPMSILEAMAYALPVISTPVGGTPETVEEGVNGFLIHPGDAKALAEKIDLLAGDKELREKMGLASYKIAKEKFDINVIMSQLREIYDELLR